MFTKYGLQRMGFEPLPAEEPLQAVFHLLRVYAVRGIKVDGDAADSGVVHAAPGCHFTIGNSVNAMARALLGAVISDDFTDDEEEWAKENRVSQPYMMCHVGPAESMSVTEGMFQRRDGKIVTHDCFPGPKEELKQREQAAMEPLLVALAAAFSTNSNPVSFHECAREVFGITESGDIVVDLQLRMSGTAYVSSHVTQDDIGVTVAAALRVTDALDHGIGRFYYIGLSERDPLKRFLYFFLFIERYTHETFGRLRGRLSSPRVFRAPERLATTVSNLEDATLEATRTLAHRFVWCALLAWPSIDDAAVTVFRDLKRERDRLSHGERTSVDIGLANQAEKLGARLILDGALAPRDASHCTEADRSATDTTV